MKKTHGFDEDLQEDKQLQTASELIKDLEWIWLTTANYKIASPIESDKNKWRKANCHIDKSMTVDQI